MGLGIPTSVESVLFCLGKLLTQVFIVGMGTAVLAANTVSIAVGNFMNVPISAFVTGVMVLVGHKIGRGERDDIPGTALFVSCFGMALMVVICLVFALLIPWFSALYKLDLEATKAFSTIMISTVIATPLLWPSAYIVPAALRATGDVKFTMFFSIASMWVFRIGLGYVFGVVLKVGVLGVYMAMYCDWLVRGVVYIHRLISNKWMGHSII